MQTQAAAPTTVASDRRNLPVSMVVALAGTTALSVGCSAQLLRGDDTGDFVAFGSGALAGALAVAALRSIPIRATSRVMCVVGAVLMVRYGAMPFDSAVGVSLTMLWALSTAGALVVASRVDRWISPGVGRSEGSPALGRSVRVAVVVGCLTAAIGLAAGPAVSAGFAGGASSGRDPFVADGNLNASLHATDRLDMARRPRLTDRVVMTVSTDTPGFWRAQTFDVWDGRSWTIADDRLALVPADGTLPIGDEDAAAADGIVTTERFRIETGYASAVPVSPVATGIDAAHELVRRADGSLIAPTGMGRGTTYTVTSRRVAPTAAQLRAGGEVPSAIAERYASRPVATDRVVALAEELTAGVEGTYDRVLAIQRWMAANLEYSLDAPLSPEDRDVVDHFLFTSKLGWCEQISSSLTVLLRLAGIPARVATGYVPGDRDPVTRRFVVREREAHAWTEVWFPDVGWVPFDPTADISLAAGGAGGVADIVAGYVPRVLFVVALLVGVGPMLRTALVRWSGRRGGVVRRWRRRGRRAADRSWPATADRRLDDIGERLRRARSPSETSTSFARDLAARTGDPRLVTVGAAVDRARFGPSGIGDEERDSADAVLESVLAAPAAERQT